jgi:Domain of unknown function (DUF1852)
VTADPSARFLAEGPAILDWELARVPYDLDYVPDARTRATTNYANLARNPATRHTNLALLFGYINRALNRQLAGDEQSRRFSVQIDILSLRARLRSKPASVAFPLTEVMQVVVHDHSLGTVEKGPTGLNFSSYLRDYDFRVLGPRIAAGTATPQEIDQFGKLHGLLSTWQFGPGGFCPEPLAVAISVAEGRKYLATAHVHELLGREYLEWDGESKTTRYFRWMELEPRFFRPPGFPAPMAFYSHASAPLPQQRPTYLAALIAVMGTFQRVYRPEIYLSRTGIVDVPGERGLVTLAADDFDRLPIAYDRNEREDLALAQAQQVFDEFLQPHREVLDALLQQSAESNA